MAKKRKLKQADEVPQSDAGLEAVPVTKQDSSEMFQVPGVGTLTCDSFKTWALWVARNMDRSDILPRDAPDVGAWLWLQRARSCDVMAQEFYRTVMPQLIRLSPRQSQPAEQFDDDGKREIPLVTRLLKEQTSNAMKGAISHE